MWYTLLLTNIYYFYQFVLFYHYFLVNGTWTEWTDWTNCSDSCGPDCIIPCGNGTMQRYRNCSQALYNGFDCIGESMENITCALPKACRSKSYLTSKVQKLDTFVIGTGVSQTNLSYCFRASKVKLERQVIL